MRISQKMAFLAAGLAVLAVPGAPSRGAVPRPPALLRRWEPLLPGAPDYYRGVGRLSWVALQVECHRMGPFVLQSRLSSVNVCLQREPPLA